MNLVTYLRQLLVTGTLDGLALVVLGYPHKDIGHVIREHLERLDAATAEGLNPGYFEDRLCEIQRALEAEGAQP